MEVMASDLDRNVFFVPLELRKKQLEQIPWVQSASVMRLLPNRLNIVVKERTPVAFVEVNSHIELIDANGVIMDLPAGQQAKYSFPVVVGMSDTEPALDARGAHEDLHSADEGTGSGGAHYSRDLSDVDLSDPDDVKATVTDRRAPCWCIWGRRISWSDSRSTSAHVQEWRAQFQKLESVDLRYEHQVIVNPDSAGSNAKSDGCAGKRRRANTEAPAPPAAPKKPAVKHKTKKHS